DFRTNCPWTFLPLTNRNKRRIRGRSHPSQMLHAKIPGWVWLGSSVHLNTDVVMLTLSQVEWLGPPQSLSIMHVLLHMRSPLHGYENRPYGLSMHLRPVPQSACERHGSHTLPMPTQAPYQCRQ